MRKRILVVAIALVLFSMIYPAFAQVNLGFETGDLTGWSTQGNVEALQSSNFSPSITPPEGNFFALLSTGPGDSPAPNGADLDGNGSPDNDITILSQTFTSPPSTLSFDWCWLTDEEDQAQVYDDIFLVRLDGSVVLSGSVWGLATSPFPDVPTDDVIYTVSSSGATHNSYFEDGKSLAGFQTFTLHIGGGTHTIEFIVADQGNHVVDSGLLVDNIMIIASVGGEWVAISKFELLAPWIGLATSMTVAAASIVYYAHRKEKQS